MTDHTTGWRLREYRHTEKRRHPWPVWEHPNTELIITQSPRGPFLIYNGLHCVQRNINGFLRARLAVERLIR
jgi:hypothetical protein